MAVVIRLQGLKISAGSEDIRSFFTGLQIPDGGVHIVGGELEEAFIIFASDEDARRAMTRSGGCIKGSPVNLLLSSKTEMQNVLEASTKTSKNGNRRMYREDGRQGETESRGQQWPVLAGTSAADPNDVFLSLFGLPFAATKEDVWLFFEGLRVDKILFLKKGDGSFSGSSIVKFASAADAAEGTKRDRQYIGSRYVRIRPVKEQVWLESGGASEPDFVPSQAGARSTPPYSQRRPDPDASRSRSPCRSRSTSPSNREFCVLVQNLSHSVATSDIQTFFHPIALGEEQIVPVMDRSGKLMRSAFVLFRGLSDYCAALSRNKTKMAGRIVYVAPVSKEKMLSVLSEGQHSRTSRSAEGQDTRASDCYGSEKVCLYVRNLPFDVRKVEIKDFFQGFRISEDSIVLLQDEGGAGLGEALVIFRTEKEATMAQAFNGQRFLGSEVMLKCISRAQMRAFGLADQKCAEDFSRDRREDRFTTTTTATAHNEMISHGLGGSDAEDRAPDSSAAGPCHGSGQEFGGPTCLKFINLPSQIKTDEIYDFCYGYRVIPGSVSLQYTKSGNPKGSATVVFQSRNEALSAIRDLSGRPIGKRKIQLVFV